MPIVDLTNPLIILLLVAGVVCAILLGYESKRSVVPAIALILCVALLVSHTLELFVFTESYSDYQGILATSMLYDLGLIVVSYLSYIWIDDIEAKSRNKKSIDNSLDWFWSKI